MEHQERVAVVILNWNGAGYLRRFIPSVVKNSPEADVYVVDNGSDDDSLLFLRQKWPEVKIIPLDKNYGFCRGYNKGLHRIEADYYVLLNSDVEVSPGWLPPLLNVLRNDASAAACQPKIKSFEHKNLYEHAGAAGGFLDKYGYPLCRGRIFNITEEDRGQYDQQREIFWASGACMLIRADIFRLSGGFTDLFFAYMEEIDLCWRIKNMGYKIYFTPESEIFHVGSGTLGQKSPKKLYFNFRNGLYLLFLNLPPNKLLPILWTRMLLDGVAAMQFLLTLKPVYFIKIFLAHLAFYRSIGKLKKIRREREGITRSYRYTDAAGLIDKSVVWQFFIRRKKKFSDL